MSLAAMSPLDNPLWSALSTRQASVALVRGRARRFTPEIGVFAAIAGFSEAALSDLAGLVRETGELGLVAGAPPPPVPGTRIVDRLAVSQMVQTAPVRPASPAFELSELTEADAAQMLALARLTEPGPFFERTHELGAFVGVKVEGRLAAMAGERMKPEGFTEVSGVCTHPDHRGHGYAAALTALVAERIHARGETPFLHVFPHNTAAISVYRRLGFSLRREMTVTVLAPAQNKKPTAAGAPRPA